MRAPRWRRRQRGCVRRCGLSKGLCRQRLSTRRSPSVRRRASVCVHGARAHRRRAALTAVARALAGRERLGAALRELREFEVELDGAAPCGKHLTQPSASWRSGGSF